MYYVKYIHTYACTYVHRRVCTHICIGTYINLLDYTHTHNTHTHSKRVIKIQMSVWIL